MDCLRLLVSGDNPQSFPSLLQKKGKKNAENRSLVSFARFSVIVLWITGLIACHPDTRQDSVR